MSVLLSLCRRSTADPSPQAAAPIMLPAPLGDDSGSYPAGVFWSVCMALSGTSELTALL